MPTVYELPSDEDLPTKPVITRNSITTLLNQVRDALGVAEGEAFELDAGNMNDDTEEAVRKVYADYLAERCWKGIGKHASTGRPGFPVPGTLPHRLFRPLATYLERPLSQQPTPAELRPLENFIRTGDYGGGDGGVGNPMGAPASGEVGVQGLAEASGIDPELLQRLVQGARGAAPGRERTVPSRRGSTAGGEGLPVSLLGVEEVEERGGARSYPSGGVAEAAGLLTSAGPTTVADVLGAEGYNKGLKRGDKGMGEMQSLYFLRTTSASYPSVLAWARAYGWKNPRNKQEAIVLAALVDGLGREAGGHERTVGSFSLELLVRRLQGLCLLERDNRKNGGAICQRWVGAIFDADMGVPVGGSTLREVEKLAYQLNGTGGKQDS